AALAAQRLLSAVEADGCPVTRELYEVAIAVHVRSGHGTTALHLHRLMEAAHPAAPATHDALPATHDALPAREDDTRPAPQGGLQRASHGASHGEAMPPAQGSREEKGKALEDSSRLEGAGDGQARGGAWSGVAGRVANGRTIHSSTASDHCFQPSPRSSSSSSSSSSNDTMHRSDGDMSSSEDNMSSIEEASSELTFLEAIDAALTHALAQ
ncbi:unnamed protein product, partial [Closterium sp. Yama58-4]